MMADIAEVLSYLPTAILVGAAYALVAGIVFRFMRKRAASSGDTPGKVPFGENSVFKLTISTLLVIYVVVVLMTVFFSRERHSRIDFQNFPAGFLLALQPARLDDQPVGDGDEMEILLPRLGPVLLFHLEGLERADPDAERFPLGNCGPEPFEIGGGALWILRVNGMDDARILPVLPAAEIKFQRGEHLRGQIEIAGLVADSDAIEHVVHDGSLPVVNGSARCLL